MSDPRPPLMWFHVRTPSVFREICLPAAYADWTEGHAEKYAELFDLAEQHGTAIRSTSYRVG